VGGPPAGGLYDGLVIVCIWLWFIYAMRGMHLRRGRVYRKGACLLLVGAALDMLHKGKSDAGWGDKVEELSVLRFECYI
jgi:hypothetical protein